jgi:hypothetical protein
MRRGFGLVVAAVASAMIAGPALLAAGAVQAPALKPPRDFKEFRDPLGRFSLVYHKDWQISPGIGSVVLTISYRTSEAIVVVERESFPIALNPNTDSFLSLEMDDLKLRTPDAQKLTSRAGDTSQKGVVFEYARTGVFGPEQLRQYSFAHGKTRYRITCLATGGRFDRHATTFGVTAASVTSAPSAGATP